MGCRFNCRLCTRWRRVIRTTIETCCPLAPGFKIFGSFTCFCIQMLGTWLWLIGLVVGKISSRLAIARPAPIKRPRPLQLFNALSSLSDLRFSSYILRPPVSRGYSHSTPEQCDGRSIQHRERASAQRRRYSQCTSEERWMGQKLLGRLMRKYPDVNGAPSSSWAARAVATPTRSSTTRPTLRYVSLFSRSHPTNPNQNPNPYVVCVSQVLVASRVQLTATATTLLANAATAARDRRAQFENRAIRVADIQFLHSGYEEEAPYGHRFCFIVWDRTSSQVLVVTSAPEANGMPHNSLVLYCTRTCIVHSCLSLRLEHCCSARSCGGRRAHCEVRERSEERRDGRVRDRSEERRVGYSGDARRHHLWSVLKRRAQTLRQQQLLRSTRTLSTVRVKCSLLRQSAQVKWTRTRSFNICIASVLGFWTLIDTP